MLDDDKNKNKHLGVDSLRKKLYLKEDTTEPVTKRSHVTPLDVNIDKGWHKEGDGLMDAYDVQEVKASQMKKRAPLVWRVMFWSAFVFFLVAVGVAYNSFFRATNDISSSKISFEITTLDFADGGEVFPFDVKVSNANPADLLNTKLVISYPRLSTSTGSDTVRQERDLGILPAGDSISESYEVQLFGETGTQQDIKISLEYEISSASEVFIKEDLHNVILRSTPIQVAVGVPPELVSGQKISIVTRVTSSSSESQDGMLLKLQYPTGFEFESASPEPTFGNNVWVLPSVITAKPFEVNIQGIPQGDRGSKQAFIALVGSQDLSNQREIAATFHSDNKQFELVAPFIEAVVKMDGRTEKREVNGNNSVLVEIEWANRTNETIRNLEIGARLSGNAFNRTAVSPSDGFFDSTTNTVIFNGNTSSKYSLVDPGETGVAAFSIVPGSLNPSPGTVLFEPMVNIDVDIRALTGGGEAKSAENIVSGTILVNTNVSLVTSTIHYSGPMDNFGPMPPESDKTTSYTLVFNLRNTSNDVENAKLETELPINVTWQDLYSPANEDVTYDPVSKKIEWDIGVLPAGTGYTTSSKTLWVQVAVTPSVNQINSRPKLTEGKIKFSGEDVLTGEDREEEKQDLTTEVRNDSSNVGVEGVVKI